MFFASVLDNSEFEMLCVCTGMHMATQLYDLKSPAMALFEDQHIFNLQAHIDLNTTNTIE
jgi:hypothetical protein